MAVHSQLQLQQFQMAAVLGGGNQAPKMFQEVVVPVPVFSEPESELTCNQSGSRKRPRDEPQPPMPPSSGTLYQQQKQQLMVQKQWQLLLLKQTAAAAADLPVESSRLLQSTMTSTSGRLPLMVTAVAAEPSPVSPGYNYTAGPGGSSSSSLISMLHYHSLEVDALIRLHEEKLRSGLDEARKRQCRAVVAAMEQQARRRVAEKQSKLDAAAKRNAELEGHLRQATVESQAWFDVARNSEALVAGLRASLEQALLRKLSDVNNNNGSSGDCAAAVDLPCPAAEEGYGDSQEEAVSSFGCSVRCAEASSSLVGAARNKSSKVNGGCFPPCKSCGDPDASVLLLPCRHLCLCPSCEPSVDSCPVCRGVKNGSFLINLS